MGDRKERVERIAAMCIASMAKDCDAMHLVVTDDIATDLAIAAVRLAERLVEVLDEDDRNAGAIERGGHR